MSFGLKVETRVFQDVVNDPALPNANGLEVTYDEIVAISPAREEPFYRNGYEPTGQETSELLPLSDIAAKRFADYYHYFNEPENIGTNDCFSLVAHLSSGQALETLRGERLRYLHRGAVTLVAPDDVEPGGLYFTGIVNGSKVTNINHHMVGIGGDRVLARWGYRSDSLIGVGRTSMAIAIYGGQLLKLSGELYRSND